MATLTLKPTLKDRFFYDQYEYNLTFRLTRAGFLRAGDHNALDNRITWHNHSAARWSNPIGETQAKDLHDFLDIIGTLSPHKHVFTSDHVYLYSNNVVELETITDLPYVRWPYATQAVINRPRDTILLTDPQYRYRTFFKERYMNKESMDVLGKFLLNRSDCFRITNELRRKLQRGNNFYTMSHYFVDHNNMEDLVMLQIVCPGIVRKTLTIQGK